jgi:tetratricopeptide (TPR) repeat protein
VREQLQGGEAPSGEPGDNKKLGDPGTRSQAASEEDVAPEGDPQAEAEVPEDARVRYELGIAYLDLGLFEECMAELRTAANDPSWAFASYRGMGECCVNIGDHDQAITHYQQALECQGASEEELLDTTYQLAQIFEQKGMAEEALRTYQRIAEMNDTYKDVNDRIVSLSQ